MHTSIHNDQWTLVIIDIVYAFGLSIRHNAHIRNLRIFPHYNVNTPLNFNRRQCFSKDENNSIYIVANTCVGVKLAV